MALIVLLIQKLNLTLRCIKTININAEKIAYYIALHLIIIAEKITHFTDTISK